MLSCWFGLGMIFLLDIFCLDMQRATSSKYQMQNINMRTKSSKYQTLVMIPFLACWLRSFHFASKHSHEISNLSKSMPWLIIIWQKTLFSEETHNCSDVFRSLLGRILAICELGNGGWLSCTQHLDFHLSLSAGVNLSYHSSRVGLSGANGWRSLPGTQHTLNLWLCPMMRCTHCKKCWCETFSRL